ncbi:MAG: alanyl-tRNA editing protein [Alphaproteobacteria bacterium]|nr:alanyl-tRNA editing protein [Alphaproteobacteria bacterium]
MTEELFREDAYARTCDATVTAADAAGIRLDRTVFYPMGGGQPGDVGVLRLPDGREIAITDTRKGEGTGDIVHVPTAGATLPAPGDAVVAEIDWDRRYRLMRMHTCLHLLCAIIEGDVTGGQIGDGKGRLDFNLPDTSLDKEAIAVALSRLIEENHGAEVRWISDEDLAARPELVRTMSVKPPSGRGRVRLLDIGGVDLQPCGGTHVRSTGEIGPVRIGKIENKGRQNRRVNVLFAE